MGIRKGVIIISEAGWQGARRLSIELSKKAIGVIVLIKGRLNKDERNMITKYKGIKNIFLPKKLFIPLSYMYIVYRSIFSALFIFATKEKTEKSLIKLKKIFRSVNLARLREANGNFIIFDLDKKPIDYKGFLGTL